MDIREERETDAEGIHRLHCVAFPSHAEANLVDRLRSDRAVCASIVAASQELIVGHALFSHAAIEYPSGPLAVGALGPVAVLPDRQRRGTGDAVIRAGLARCWALGLPAVIVLGHPRYYGRFGFQRADTWAIRCEFNAPPEAFMIAWAATPIPGPAVAKYHPAFTEV